NLAVRSWLINAGTRTILVDTCIGNHKERPRWPTWHQRSSDGYLRALSAAGVSPEAVDIVFCTHLHADHVGWNTTLRDGRWVPTFKNARTLVGRADYLHYEALATDDKHGAFADSVAPIMEHGLMDLVDDGYDLGPGLTLTASPGHSPGHMCLEAPGGIFAGDAIHSPFQLADPTIACAFDTDAALAIATRLALLERVAESGVLLIPTHFPARGRARIARHGHGFRAL
ncbi:MAG: MBL fold metallo-hydrolase, partial [Pseudomonadota bacterium]